VKVITFLYIVADDLREPAKNSGKQGAFKLKRGSPSFSLYDHAIIALSLLFCTMSIV